MIGIVIPAHNEEATLGHTLESALLAARHPALQGEAVHIVVVLDACTDGSEGVARGWPVHIIKIDAQNVGKARARGADQLLTMGCRWLAFTDADTVVSPSWLCDQLSLGVDAVCGSVGVDDWSPYGDHAISLQRQFAAGYCDADGHRHVHGANLGVSADAYRRAGGFPALACGEDVALVDALIACGAHIAWSALPRVSTSARIEARARGGFGDTLLALHHRGLAHLMAKSPVKPVPAPHARHSA